jgi:hypothetical protein
VNVWLRDCPDCADAFDAWPGVHPDVKKLGLTVVNVSVYGPPKNLGRLRDQLLADNVVIDAKGKVFVTPLKISSFETLLLDGQGYVRFRERPSTDGFLARLKRAVTELRRSEKKG